MDPLVTHPVVHCGPADSRHLERKMDRQKSRFFVANLAEEDGHDRQALHFPTQSVIPPVGRETYGIEGLLTQLPTLCPMAAHQASI